MDFYNTGSIQSEIGLQDAVFRITKNIASLEG